MDEPHEVLQEIRARQGMTIDDLVDEAARLLPTVADHQTRYKVTDRPDVRTIRYYVTRGLLPRASGYQGGRARYGGTHLIRLLLIKKLQAEHHTLSRISGTLERADDSGVIELLLGEDQESAMEGGAQAQTHSPGAFAAGASGPATGGGTLSSRTVRRIELPGGASLDVPEETLASPIAVEELVKALEVAAETLRSAYESDE